MTYPVIYERSANGWWAYLPDLPGCVALGFTLDETKQLIQEWPSTCPFRLCLFLAEQWAVIRPWVL